MSGRPTKPPVASRDLACATMGAAAGGATLLTASAVGLNRPLVLTALVLGCLTLWSALQWVESTADQPGQGRLDPAALLGFDQRARTVSDGPSVTEHIVDPPWAPDPKRTVVEAGPMGRNVDSTKDADVPAAMVVPAASWVELDDLTNDLRFRELQCGTCASYEVTPDRDSRSGPDQALSCRRCGARTALDPTGRPHAVLVRSNPQRMLERSGHGGRSHRRAHDDRPTTNQQRKDER